MRIRTVKPEFWADEGLSAISRDARLLFIATFNMADDEGLLRWNPAYLKAEAFMYDSVDVTYVEGLASEIVTADLIHPYQAGNQRLGWIVNFHKHQRINRPQPSKTSPPSLQNAAVALRYARRDRWTCHLCGGPVNETPYYVVDPYSSSDAPDISSLNPSLDHVRPRADGGSDHPSNIRLAHIGCNKGRGSRPVETFKVPPSVIRALGALTSADADSVIEVNPFSAESLNDHGTDEEPSVTEGNGRGREGSGMDASTPTRRRASSPMPVDWAPNDAHKEAAHKKGIDVGVEAESFKSWSQSKDSRYVDWDAAFRNWLTKARVTPQNAAAQPTAGTGFWDRVVRAPHPEETP